MRKELKWHVGSHRARRLPVAPAAVDAADLRLRAGDGETLEIWPETQQTIPTEVKETDRFVLT